MRCSKCGGLVPLDSNVCPNCHSVILKSDTSNNNVDSQVDYEILSEFNSDENKENVSTSQDALYQSATNDHALNSSEIKKMQVPLEDVSVKKDMSKVYYIILGVAFVIFLVLMFLVVSKHLKSDKVSPSPDNKEKITTHKETIMSKNKGVYSNLISPVSIGEVTYGGLSDSKTGKIVDADVEIVRHLDEVEILSIISTSNQVLNPGFRWDGVLYRVTLNDFDYLGESAIEPKMKTFLFDTYYKNNFFLVNENYYTIDAITSPVNPIKNGESALVSVAYQVPLEENYYICFGENFSSLGCFINS